MSSTLPPHPTQTTEPLWTAIRFTLIAWSAIVLVRHGSYWVMTLADGWQPGQRRALLLASIECVCLLTILVMSFVMRYRNRPPLNVLAASCIGFSIVVLVGLALELIATSLIQSAFSDSRAALRAMWVTATRLQYVVVPAMAIVALWKR